MMLVELKNVGVTYTTVPVTWLVSETVVELPKSNLLPVNVMLPVVMEFDDMLYNNGLLSESMKENQQLEVGDVQFVGIINLLSTVTTWELFTA